MLFNLATLNYDAHGTSISFFVIPTGLELAPFYDLVNIELCVTLMQTKCDHLLAQASSVPEMSKLL